MVINRRKFTYLAGMTTLLATLPTWAASSEEQKLAPALFMGHGSPMNAFTSNAFTNEWEVLSQIIQKPKAILVVSAHWETQFPAVSTSAKPAMIYDFYGFPDFMYEAHYDALGAPMIAQTITQTFQKKIFADQTQGLDHGAWSVLMRLFPKADVPVFQLSLAQSMTPQEHLELAQEMRYLREQGVMILGSGNITHNLRSAHNDSKLGMRKSVHDWARNFDEIVTSKIDAGDFKALAHYEKLGQDATMSVSTPEHFLPLLYVLGSTHKNERATYFAKGFQDGSFSMRSVLFA